MRELTKADRELLDAAAETIRRRYAAGWHEIGAAVRTAGGRIITALNIDGYNSICAEAAAIARAVAEGEEDLAAVVAVRYDPESGATQVVPPCGRCRDLISEFGDVEVVYPTAGGVRVAPISELLPNPFEPRGSRRRGASGSPQEDLFSDRNGGQ